ncbi:MAG: LysR family transcriptional regulator [Archangium gephyra]|uniref:LysR family transcriptional regulator n=1 Tax=Archangium gephyra TaxID=48 RepID=A0A2W5TFY7_9BACT|nr:MAG: LysR family transcriptional regulator [Archangium gephyra]
MNWDDLRYVLAVTRLGSFARAGKALGVDHTTVARRVEAAERSLKVKLFTRTTTGLALTPDGERLVEPLRGVEASVNAFERAATSREQEVDGPIRVTSPETFGVTFLAPRLAAFGRQHPKLRIELVPGGTVLDLGRREAEVAVRFFKSKPQDLVVRRVADVHYGLYASRAYLRGRPFTGELGSHRLVSTPPDDASVESTWLRKLVPRPAPVFVSDFSTALLAAARADAGITVLPRYLGDAEPALQHLPMPNAPSEALWLTVHRDLKDAPRVRVVLDFLAAALRDEQPLLSGR